MPQAIKSNLYLKASERKKFEGFSFTTIPIKCDGEDCFVIVKGNFKLFEQNNKGKKSYSQDWELMTITENGGNL